MRRRSRLRRGAAMMEFALILPFLIGVIMAVVELSRFMSFAYRNDRLARDSCRYAATLTQNLSEDGPAEAEDIETLSEMVVEHFIELKGETCEAGCTITGEVWETDSGQQVLTVSVVREFPALFNAALMGAFPDEIQSTFTMRTQMQP